YEGSARSIAIGYAFTSVGGDLGAIGINPAGSGLYRYSKFMFTPSLATTKRSTDYLGMTSYENMSKLYFSAGYVNSINNNRNTSRIRGVNISIAINRLNNFNSRLFAEGREAQTSWLGAIAANTAGFPSSELDIQSSDDTYPYFESGAPWKSVLAWNSNLLDLLPDSSEDYIAATENISGLSIIPAGDLDQNYLRETKGGASEFIVNLSANISDRLFIGGSVGIQSIQYSDYQRYGESAVNTSDFDSQFRSFTHIFRLNTTGTGINAKAGVIFIPFEGLRLGAAVATPTYTTLTDEWDESIRSVFSDGYSQSITSPLGQFKYIVVSPARFNFGASFVFGKYGLITADYELADYSAIKMKVRDSYQRTAFSYENESISEEFILAGNLRIGVEFRPSPSFAIRAGYSNYQSAERDFNDAVNFVAAGLGYRGSRGFFADVAFQGLVGSSENFSLYDDYRTNVSSPVGELTKSGFKILTTIGFRF
ncbi:MAG: hypothetical protein PHT63_04170, partial [Bacteroidales bacterium]|nr:hypothetical protein [Bacteroidales bacterium]